jgi:hypothetical protein
MFVEKPNHNPFIVEIMTHGGMVRRRNLNLNLNLTLLERSARPRPYRSVDDDETGGVDKQPVSMWAQL